jgi:hypothetical protein
MVNGYPFHYYSKYRLLNLGHFRSTLPSSLSCPMCTAHLPRAHLEISLDMWDDVAFVPPLQRSYPYLPLPNNRKTQNIFRALKLWPSPHEGLIIDFGVPDVQMDVSSRRFGEAVLIKHDNDSQKL